MQETKKTFLLRLFDCSGTLQQVPLLCSSLASMTQMLLRVCCFPSILDHPSISILFQLVEHQFRATICAPLAVQPHPLIYFPTSHQPGGHLSMLLSLRRPKVIMTSTLTLVVVHQRLELNRDQLWHLVQLLPPTQIVVIPLRRIVQDHRPRHETVLRRQHSRKLVALDLGQVDDLLMLRRHQVKYQLSISPSLHHLVQLPSHVRLVTPAKTHQRTALPSTSATRLPHFQLCHPNHRILPFPPSKPPHLLAAIGQYLLHLPINLGNSHCVVKGAPQLRLYKIAENRIPECLFLILRIKPPLIV